MANFIELQRCILISVLIFLVLFHEFVEGRSITATVKNTNINKAIIKTIEGEDGEIIDCFDIYKQPAFDHPLLRNHTIQMRPTSYPKGMKADNFEAPLIQSWHKKGKCPAGTVPILRAPKSTYDHTLAPLSPKRYQKTHHKNQQNPTIEYALVSAGGNKFHGAEGIINIWKPTLQTSSEFSASYICVQAGSSEKGDFNTAEAGWIVHPKLYGDDKPRFFTYWSSQPSQSGGCYNLLCPGFVITSSEVNLGAIMEPVSVFNGTQYDASVVIFKDENAGNWWVKLKGQLVGYWPSSIFNTLADAATEIQWGGAVLNRRSDEEGHHTRTEMGSGHFPAEGFQIASYFHNIKIIDENFTVIDDPENLQTFSTNSNCYAVHLEDYRESWSGTYFYYGGVGFSDNLCKW